MPNVGWTEVIALAAAYLIATITTPAGISGAVLLLPFQVSVLGTPSPSVTPTNLRTGAIGHNGFKSDFDMGHGGFKQSGIGREGGVDGLLPFLESKAVLLDSPTARYRQHTEL